MPKRILGVRGKSMRSARAIANRMRELGFALYATSNDHGNNIVINWGSRNAPPGAINGAYNYSKYTQLKALQEAGISCLVPLLPGEIVEEDFPVFGRSFQHQAGQDIEIFHSPLDLKVRDYYTSYTEFTTELRVHFLRDGPIKVQVKENPEDDREIKIRNAENGYHFRKSSASNALVEFCQRVLDCLHLDFMCADIGKIGGTYKIIEVNTAPSVVNNQNTLEMYVQWFLSRGLL